MDESSRSKKRPDARFRRVSWALVGLYMGLALPGLDLQFRIGRFMFLDAPQVTVSVAVMLAIIAVVGALLVSRQPRHPAD